MMAAPTSSAEQSSDVVVIGGGIVGLSSALELQERGRKVTLIDPDKPRARASFGNMGVISRGSIFTVAGPGIWGSALRYVLNRDAGLRLRYSAFPHYARWMVHFLKCCNEAHWRRAAKALNPLVGAAYEHHERLAKWTGAEALVKRNGYLKAFRYEQTFESSALQREMLTEAGIRFTVVGRDEIRDLEPSFKDVFCKGMFFPDTGSVDSPGELVDHYQRAFVARGGTYMATHASAIEHGSDTVTVHLRNGARVRGAHAVLSAGVWSAELIKPLGYHVPMAAERGYHQHFELPPGVKLNRSYVDTEMNYGAAQIGNALRIDTGVEMARPDDPPDYTQLKQAVEATRSVIPFGDPVPGTEWMGSRPSTPDGLPIIGRAPRHPRLVFAFGHNHIGLSTGPVTGRIVAALLANEPPPVPVSIAPFSIERFA